MKIAGFFEEFWPEGFGTTEGPVAHFRGESPLEDEELILRYLINGFEIVSVLGAVDDVLGSGERVLAGDSILTDGEWIWRADLRFYVRKYHVRLPEEFLAKARKLDHSVPEIPGSRLREIAQSVMRIL
ncbi:hypothetical protein [Streptomyces albus]|uniref:hypothetical protein n=1 Tax=Streptomyces albus TaxID=1888 RepID=UPI0004CB45C4|nr:hypothetical protein [Streptomyces albus]